MSFRTAIPRLDQKSIAGLVKLTDEERKARVKELTATFTILTNNIREYSKSDSSKDSRAPKPFFEPAARCWDQAYSSLAEIKALSDMGAVGRDERWFAINFQSASDAMASAYMDSNPYLSMLKNIPRRIQVCFQAGIKSIIPLFLWSQFTPALSNALGMPAHPNG